MPTLQPFRALRYDRAAVGDLSGVICPPYDVISPDERTRLLARHPRNAVRIELPLAPGDVPSGDDPLEADPYRGAAERLRAWRADGTLRLDGRAAVYVYEERYPVLGAGEAGDRRTQRGFFALLRLEPFGAGIRPHERTLSAPKEDRLRLLRATATDVSPIVVLADDPDGRVAMVLDRVAATPPHAEAMGADETRHRMWAVPAEEADARDLIREAGARPLTVADGHHRFETALHYRDETDNRGVPEGVRPEDFVLTLVLDSRAADGPTILPTHRIVGGGRFGRLWGLAREVGTVTRVTFDEATAAFSPPFQVVPGRVGLLGRDTAWLIERDRSREADLFDQATPEVVRSLDVAFVQALLRRAGDGDVRYTHEAAEALAVVRSGSVSADAAFLLQPTSVGSVIAVAAAGALMPQKSTYFSPKAATGLVMYALE